MKACRSCVNCVSQVYDSKAQAAARCCHIAFLKAGFGRSKEGSPLGAKLELFYECKTEKMAKEEVLELFAKNFFYYDLIDIKAGRQRFCQHYKHPLANFDEVLSSYGYIDQYILEFPDVHPVLVQWIKDGKHLVNQHFGKLQRNMMFEYDTMVVPQEVTDSYNSCSACEYYEIELTEEGAPMPYRGRCFLAPVPEPGLLADSFGTETEAPVTFSFNGCTRFRPNPMHGDNVPQDLPGRLVVVVETNPIDLTVAQYAQMYRSSAISRNRSVEQEDYNALMETKLVPLLRKRHGTIDFLGFGADFDLQPVNDFFAKSLRSGTDVLKKQYDKIRHYKEADDVLFGPASEKISDKEVDEGAVQREFGSRFVIKT